MGAMLYFYIQSNVHTVIPNVYYRSAQLDASQLALLIQKKNIKSVINLRGPDQKAKWYQQEIKISSLYGVKHYDLPLRAYVLPNPDSLRRLASLLLTAPKPVLIHCEGGADRTGLAAAFALLLNNASLAKARKQISITDFVVSSKSVGLQVLPYYAQWLKNQKVKSNRKYFLMWLTQLTFKRQLLTN